MKEVNTGAEKRQYPRVETHIPVRYRIQNDAAEILVSGSLTGDVSVGGLRLRTKEVIPAACDLILELDFPALEKPIRATSKVAWVKRADAEEGYEVGNRFMEISGKDQELIAQYVHGLR